MIDRGRDVFQRVLISQDFGELARETIGRVPTIWFKVHKLNDSSILVWLDDDV